ncbi:hypothetical protein ACAG96_05770 [Candidatus Izemoplasma sp. B36]|uniref:hypothetical protein n=1 Tax=Candidatus Izemoplasma sp. B36 TaxID=3242468 RepID=UPI00355840BD
MTVSFFKRMFSSVIDVTLVILVVYLSFVVGGRTILRNRIDNFDEIYSTYNEILETYNSDIQDLQTEYEANIELANEDEELEAAATAEYQAKLQLVNDQNAIDIEPYNEPLSQYFIEIIYYFSIGFLVFVTILAMAMRGNTPGRRMLSIKLVVDNGSGEYIAPNPIFVLFHDVLLKYFFIVVVFIISMYYGVIMMMVGFIIDLLLMGFTRNHTTIRDILLKIKVIKR